MHASPSPETTALHTPPMRHSLHLQLTLLVGVMLALVMTVTLATDHFYERSVMRRQIHDHLSSVAAGRSDAVQTYIRFQQERLAAITGRLLLRYALADRAAQNSGAEASRSLAQQSLANTDALLPHMLGIRLTDAHGTIIAAHPVATVGASAAAEPAFQAGLGGVHLGLPTLRGERYESEFAAPVLHQGRTLGVLLVTADVTPLADLLRDTTGLGGSGEVMLAVRKGDEAWPIFPGRDPATGASLAKSSAMAAALAGREFVGETLDGRGVEVVAAAGPVGYGGWGLVAKVDASDAYAPLVRGNFVVLWLGLAGTLLGLAMAWALARRFTRPILQLAEAAQRVARGDLDIAVPVTDQTEVGALTARFNDMIGALRARTAERDQAEGQIRQNNRDLELRVAERVAELADKARLLTEQNAEVEQARHTLEEKAAELALTSRYKSEFLANMSHELRTPLNSILIFSQQLAQNTTGNLTDKQVEFSNYIHASGTDLLQLISDILDLSKIESGTVSVEVEDILFAEVRDTIDRDFRHVAQAKKLSLQLRFAQGLPDSMASDPMRLRQIVKNLLSNAIKFTARGQVEVRVDLATQGWSADHPVLGKARHVVAFAVEDSGIGIAPDKQRLVFEAFQQGDAGTARQYGGTGLGLAISRELAGLLGGEITLASVQGEGSTFTLYLPLHYAGPISARAVLPPPGAAAGLTPKARELATLSVAPEVRIADDRNDIQPGDPALLIIENDPHYAHILLGLARDKGFKGIVCVKGAQGLALARQYRPAAIVLDIYLPDVLGWTVLNQLKLDPATRHIPVQIVTVEEEHHHGLAHGAFAYLIKSPTMEGLKEAFDRIKDFTAPRTRRLLIVEDNAIEREAIELLLGHDDIESVAVATGAQALAALREQAFDCLVLDLRLPDMSGFELLEAVQAQPALAHVPVVVFTGKDLSADENLRLRKVARSIVLKDVDSPDRLLHETALFLHRVVTDLPAEKQAMLERLLGDSGDVLRGCKVLVVDDDARNVFALTAVLENHDLEVIGASGGIEAIGILQRTPGIAIVLMDIMMPGMDGFETMRKIRQEARFRSLPILALTAKAMKGDREKCLQAGASDYIAKPVDTDQLLSLMRVWLFR